MPIKTPSILIARNLSLSPKAKAAKNNTPTKFQNHFFTSMRPSPAPTAKNLIHTMSPPLSSGEPQMSATTTSTSPSTCDPHACRWRPYSNSNDFEANAAMVLIILFCALICSLALNAAIRCFLRGGGGRPRHYSRNSHQLPRTQQELEQRKPTPEAAAARMVAAPTMVYSTGLNLAGAEAECAICLSEFVEGEGIQVLAKCKHGFHVQCIQQWLSSHSSCPTCRSSCLSPPPSSEETTHHCVDSGTSRPVMPESQP